MYECSQITGRGGERIVEQWPEAGHETCVRAGDEPRGVQHTIRRSHMLVLKIVFILFPCNLIMVQSRAMPFPPMTVSYEAFSGLSISWHTGVRVPWTLASAPTPGS